MLRRTFRWLEHGESPKKQWSAFYIKREGQVTCFVDVLSGPGARGYADRAVYITWYHRGFERRGEGSGPSALAGACQASRAPLRRHSFVREVQVLGFYRGGHVYCRLLLWTRCCARGEEGVSFNPFALAVMSGDGRGGDHHYHSRKNTILPERVHAYFRSLVVISASA